MRRGCPARAPWTRTIALILSSVLAGTRASAQRQRVSAQCRSCATIARRRSRTRRCPNRCRTRGWQRLKHVEKAGQSKLRGRRCCLAQDGSQHIRALQAACRPRLGSAAGRPLWPEAPHQLAVGVRSPPKCAASWARANARGELLGGVRASSACSAQPGASPRLASWLAAKGASLRRRDSRAQGCSR